jgi:hypothetical protein
MKSGIISKVILFGLLAVATIAFAADNDPHKARVQFTDPIQVNGTQLKAGTYTVQWNGAGPSVEITIVSGGKVLATATATIVEDSAKYDSVQTSTTSDGARTLKAIRFSGKKYSLEIGGDSAKAADSKKSAGTN